MGIGLATAIKLTPAIFVVYLLATRRFRRAAAGAIVTAVVAGLVAAAADRRRLVAVLDRRAVAERPDRAPGRVPNQSLLGALARLPDPHPPPRCCGPLLVADGARRSGLTRATRAARGR